MDVTLDELARLVGGTVTGDGRTVIRAPESSMIWTVVVTARMASATRVSRSPVHLYDFFDHGFQ